MRRSALAILLSLGVVSSGAPARAQSPEGASIALAEALFTQGRALLDQGRHAEACLKLAESQRLDPKLGTLLNLAVCHEKEGKTATAWAEYISAASLARGKGQKDREQFARDHVAELKKKLAYVVLRMEAPPAGLGMKLDDKPIDVAALNVPLPIDPGKHTVTAIAPGKRAWTGELLVPAQPGEIPVEIPALEEVPAPPPEEIKPPPAPAIPPMKPPPAEPTTPKETGPSASTILMVTGFGGGGAALLVGAVTGIVTLAKASEILPNCNGSRCPGQKDALAAANTLANVSNIGFGVAIVGLGVGIAGVALAPKREATPPAAFSVTPLLGPLGIGLRGTF
ncbi:tetratricopeptide repeat protein [Polyangium sp. 6x1]|uniref:tetratricopeptide repeat protein n=1 Tax=Polyangium sp. 6x1 TaxID=3042689 RepID=UPI0024821453|nr:tetratricopeptide repeat protein [Polyangium sp. 6x1]MDI1450368.1 tetratricopeptide repeat protein [Polyangium sp. 6x1]